MKHGYLKHSGSWICPVCLYYRIKEVITGKDCEYHDDFCVTDEEKE